MRPPLAHYAPELNTIERRALSYLQSRTQASGEPPLTDGDRAELTRIRNWTVFWSAVSGTVSGLIIGGFEIYLSLEVIDGGADRSMLDDPWPWAGFYLFVALLTVVEIAVLYWLALRAISRIREVIGIAIDEEHASQVVEAGLARGALELPNPHRTIYGVDPYASISRWKLLVWNLLYKAKVGATSFALRILMRRVLARAVLRGYIPLLAVPLYAGWNAFILWRVMEEARLRALGPFAVRQALDLVYASERSEEWRKAALHGTAEMIRRSGDAHPSYALILSQLLRAFDMQDDEIETRWDEARGEIEGLTEADRGDIAELLVMTAILAGRPNREQLHLLEEVHKLAGRTFDMGKMAAFRLRLRDGLPFGNGHQGSA